MAKNEVTTTDLSEFGYRELDIVKELIEAMQKNGFPDDFIEEEVTIMFNKNSGEVFFTNSEFQVCMVADGKLYSFYNCCNCGHEGYEEEGFSGEDKSLCDECKKKEVEEKGNEEI
jgi:formylmethanofuran dehydrogenase subunit E